MNLKEDFQTVKNKIDKEGYSRTVSLTKKIFKDKKDLKRFIRRNPDPVVFYDVVFVNGCDYSVPHPIRYRVDHQIQQLTANNYTCLKIEASNLKIENLAQAHTFIIFRCPFTPFIGEFINTAHKLNKDVYFDIDDLVIDTVYTNTIPFVASMSQEQKALYDDGVNRMKQTLLACGKAITTTERLALELKKYVPEVVINRNVASEDMLFYSNRAIYERDVLPFLEDNEIEKHDITYRNWTRKHQQQRSKRGIVLGYFSGSITHNDDIKFLAPALVEILSVHQHASLLIVGELDIPSELEPFQSRIIKKPFCEWPQLPQLIASVDINLSPLTNSIFNEAKSENKWIEAALVKVPTIASNIGAFEIMIQSGQTGILCNTVQDWVDALHLLISNKEKRDQIAENAYRFCLSNCTTVSKECNLAHHFNTRKEKTISFICQGFKLSGGQLVIHKHAALLQEAGWDVTMIDIYTNSIGNCEKLYYLMPHENSLLPVVAATSKKNKDIKLLLQAQIQNSVSTLWATNSFFYQYAKQNRKAYLVQGYETQFYEAPDPVRLEVSRFYCQNDVRYLSVSRWCQTWLEKEFHHKARYAPNGINTALFYPTKRDFEQNRKIRILIEGDSASYYKNIDEAFLITNKLPSNLFEIWYVSYNAQPKKHYRIDKFLHAIPNEKMPDIYRSCDILLKTSILESFSYPPLEMMATGGFVVALLNEGNSEYLKDEYNCLLYEKGNYQHAINQINRIIGDEQLRQTLYVGGLETAQERDWNIVKEQIIGLYE